MMMKFNFLSILILIVMLPACQYTKKTDARFNLDFEKIDYNFPSGWEVSEGYFSSSDYTISLNSTEVQSGKYSVLFECKGDFPTYAELSFTLPENYDGKQICLSGYIKTENVTDGYAGLWMQIDPAIAFDNMSERGIRGTSDWKKYEITLDMNPSETDKITIGGFLSGKGKMWLDNLKVTIDSIEIQHLTPYKKTLFPAEQDHEFDTGSNIVFPKLDKQHITDLELLGKIWGFLKYYHPAIANGNYNWDYELFRILPVILHSKSKEDRNNILYEWIENLGEVQPAINTYSLNPDSVKIYPDIEWIEDKVLLDSVSNQLIDIKNASRSDKHYYIDYRSKYRIEKMQYSNPTFKHENGYESLNYIDAGYRLLSLFRYWNIIQYHYPYKYLTDEDWNDILPEFIPKFVYATTKQDYKLILARLISRIHDSHASIPFIYDSKGNNIVPVEITFVENQAVVTKLYKVDGNKKPQLQIGDIILKIDNKSVDYIIQQNIPITSASNYPTLLRNISFDLLRTDREKLFIHFDRNGELMTDTISCVPINQVNISYKSSQYKPLIEIFKPHDITYLYLGSAIGGTIPNKITSKGMIIDLRGYPTRQNVKGYWNFYYLYPHPIEFVKFTHGSAVMPGLFIFSESLKIGAENTNYYKGKKVLLVDEWTASHAEFMAMKYQCSPNTIIIGSTTVGADGDVSRISLPGGLQTAISGIGVYYPDGKETQRIGIIPNIEIKSTIKGIREGRDELLEKAIEIINNTK
ncbi:MAG: peptidase S41 [Dysgonamonadaceae bacterium]|jgi:hypothetical protein|nr:peptidase S41 [Dysgonamonadaceae bacterium]